MRRKNCQDFVGRAHVLEMGPGEREQRRQSIAGKYISNIECYSSWDEWIFWCKAPRYRPDEIQICENVARYALGAESFGRPA